jgi:hypothetical protein
MISNCRGIKDVARNRLDKLVIQYLDNLEWRSCNGVIIGVIDQRSPLGVSLPVALLFACSLLVITCDLMIAPCYGRSLVVNTFIDQRRALQWHNSCVLRQQVCDIMATAFQLAMIKSLF